MKVKLDPIFMESIDRMVKSIDTTPGVLTDDLKQRFKQNELLEKVCKAVLVTHPDSRIFYTEDTLVEDIVPTLFVEVTGVTEEECEAIGNEIFPGYNLEDYGVCGSPLYVHPFRCTSPCTYDVTSLWRV